MKNYKIYQFILIFTPFVFSFAFGLDIYIPIVPQMTEIFSTSQGMIQLTLSLFLFITGAGQLFVGPLSDQYGRKIVLYASSAFYAIGALGCIVSPNIYWLLFFRVVSGFGACGMLVTAFAIVRDLFTQEKSAKMYSFLNGATGISPTFAPILGGYLALYFGWTSVFIFLAFIGMIALMITKQCVKETHPKENRVKVDKQIFARYWEIFTHRKFIKYALIAALADSVFFCFFSVSPVIIIKLHEVPAHEFGYYFALFGLVIAIGGFVGGKIVEKVGISLTIAIGIALVMLGGVSMLACHYLSLPGLFGFLIPMAISCAGAMFLIGASASAALEPFGLVAGTAAAAFGCIEFGLSAFAGSVLMAFPIASSVPYALSLVIIALLLMGMFLIKEAKAAKEAC